MPKLTRLMILAAVLVPAAAKADIVTISVTVENLAPANSVSITPLRVGFNNGTYDSFNQGQPAGPAIVSIAEGGTGSAWFPAFAAADPGAVLGSVGNGALLPGATATNTFTVDTAVNPFFIYGAMVVPSNDFFLGNDSPTALRLFDAAGNLIFNGFTLKANRIWDAGSEAFDPANAAFLVVGNNDGRTPQNGVVNFNFAELSGFNGLETAAGYTFNSQLTADTDVFRVSFTATPAVPVPPSAIMALTGVLGFVGVRRWRA